MLRPRLETLVVDRRRRLLLGPCRLSTESSEEERDERLLRLGLPSAGASLSALAGGDCRGRFVVGGGDLDRVVETVETELSDETEADLSDDLPSTRRRFLALSSATLASCSSATPFFCKSELGTSSDSLGISLGLSSCCVRDGRAT